MIDDSHSCLSLLLDYSLLEHYLFNSLLLEIEDVPSLNHFPFMAIHSSRSFSLYSCIVL